MWQFDLFVHPLVKLFFFNSQVTSEQYCRAQQEAHHDSHTYLCLLTSTRNHQLLHNLYHSKGERGPEEVAGLVGLRLPKQPGGKGWEKWSHGRAWGCRNIGTFHTNILFCFLGSDCHFSPDAGVQSGKLLLKVLYVILVVCYLSVRNVGWTCICIDSSLWFSLTKHFKGLSVHLMLNFFFFQLKNCDE